MGGGVGRGVGEDRSEGSRGWVWEGTPLSGPMYAVDPGGNTRDARVHGRVWADIGHVVGGIGHVAGGRQQGSVTAVGQVAYTEAGHQEHIPLPIGYMMRCLPHLLS